MQLKEYLDKRQKPSIQRWLTQNPVACDEAKEAILTGAPRALVYNWLVDYHAFQFGMTTFRGVADAWEKGAHGVQAA